LLEIPSEKIQSDPQWKSQLKNREFFLAPDFEELSLNLSRYPSFERNHLNVLLEQNIPITKRKHQTGIEPAHHLSIKWEEHFATVN